MKLTVASIIAVILSGCGLLPRSSGVNQLGPDTYTITADDLNPSKAKQVALSEANSFCKSLDKHILVQNTSAQSGKFERSVVEVTFACLRNGDPQLQRPNYTAKPDVVVEDRRGK